MGRRSGFTGLIFAVAREAARAQRRSEAASNRTYKSHLHEQKNAERAAAKFDKVRYLELRIDEATDMTNEIAEKVKSLKEIIEHTLKVNDRINFDSLRIKDKFRRFSVDKDLAVSIPEPKEVDFLSTVKSPGFASRLIPGSSDRYEKAIAIAKGKFHEALGEYVQKEADRKIAIEKANCEYQKEKNEFELKVKQRDVEVDELENNYKKGDPDAVCSYNTMVLERSEYPDGFPQEFKIAYVPESKQLVVDYELPNNNIVPDILEYRYIKRKSPEIKDIYQDVVASLALRTCHELFEADQGNHLDVVVFNGFVQTVDPSTGKDVRPFLVSVRATKDKFLELDLARVDRKACLRNLGAQLSPKPYDVQPVKPIVEFNMVDKRFVEQSDVLWALKQN
jgi:restriction system protein